MNTVLWILQIVLGFQFLFAGYAHFTLPDGLPAMMSWIYDLGAQSPGLGMFSGTVEVLGGLGLILPGLFKIQTRLTPLAAAGLALVMVGAIFWHIPRGEMMQVGTNVLLGGLAAFVAYRRWKVDPLPEKSAGE